MQTKTWRRQVLALVVGLLIAVGGAQATTTLANGTTGAEVVDTTNPK